MELSLTKESKKRLDESFESWCRETGQSHRPDFAVIADVRVKSGKVKPLFLDNKQYDIITKAIDEVMKLKAREV